MDIEKRVRDNFNNQPYMQHLGAKLIKVDKGICNIEMPFHRNLTQQNGFFHAGSIASIADTAAGYAAYSLMDADSDVLAVEFKLNLLRPAVGEKLIAKGTVLKPGKTLSVCRVDIFAVNKGDEKLCAAAQATMFQVKPT